MGIILRPGGFIFASEREVAKDKADFGNFVLKKEEPGFEADVFFADEFFFEDDVFFAPKFPVFAPKFFERDD